jgi:hypothetical protein
VPSHVRQSATDLKNSPIPGEPDYKRRELAQNFLLAMLDQLTLLLATPIAKAVLDKFYESAGSKLGEKAVELVPDKVKQLGQLVWDKCLRDKIGAGELVEQAANGSAQAQQTLTENLHTALDANDGALPGCGQTGADRVVNRPSQRVSRGAAAPLTGTSPQNPGGR